MLLAPDLKIEGAIKVVDLTASLEGVDDGLQFLEVVVDPLRDRGL
jgi:hypothetical protein